MASQYEDFVNPEALERLKKDGEALEQLFKRVETAAKESMKATKGALSGGAPKNITDAAVIDASIKKINDYNNALDKVEQQRKKLADAEKKSRLAEIKLEQDREKAFDRYEQELQKKTANEAKANSEYNKQSQTLKALKKEYYDVALALGKDSAEAQKLLNQLRPLDSKLKDLNKSAGDFHREIGKQTSTMSEVKGGLLEIGGALGIAFGVHQVKEFASESVKAYFEAEDNAVHLFNAVKQNTVVFDKLIAQSGELQEKSIFSDDDIQKAQTQLGVLGLTGDQIEKLTPQITDLASKMRIDLASATDIAIKALNGKTKGLKEVGLEFKGTNSRLENYNMLTEKLTALTGASAQALESEAGKIKRLENFFDDFKEKVGEYLVNEGVKILDNFEALGNAADVFVRKETVRITDAMDEVNKKTLKSAQESEEGRLKAIRDTEQNVNALIENVGKSRNNAEIKLRMNLVNNQKKLLADLHALNKKQVMDNQIIDEEEKDKKVKTEEDFGKKLRDLQTENIRISYDRRKKEIDDNFDDEAKKYAGHTEILEQLQKRRLNQQEDAYRQHQQEMDKIRKDAMKVEKLDTMKAEDTEFSSKVKANQDKIIKDKKKADEEKKMAIEKFADLYEIWRDYNEKVSQENMASIDFQLQKNESAIDQQLQLAAAGMDNTLAFEMQKRDELEKGRIEELERQKKVAKQQEAVELSLAFLKAYENYIGKDMKSGEALVRAFADVSAAKMFGKVLAGSAEKGVEDTGRGLVNMDGKGGMLWMLHPNERVLNKGQNDQLKGLSNEEVVHNALMYENIARDNFNSSMMLNDVSKSEQVESATSGLLLKQVEKLTDVMKNKPDNLVSWDNFGHAVQKAIRNGNSKTIIRQTYLPS